MANPSGSSPSVADRPGRRRAAHRGRRSARPTVSMPVTWSPSLVTTSPARRPFQAMPWSKMWPRPSHCVEACSGMKITSSAPPRPCGKPWVPRSASSAGVEHGVHRVGAPPPALLRAVRVEATAPARSSRRGGPARRPRRRFASSRKFSVPSTSSAPQRPQLRAALGRGGDGALGIGAVAAAARCTRRHRIPASPVETRIREDEMSDARVSTPSIPSSA